ncbi:MAG: type II toxin-antitoxin system RelE/ParE family toxin, partial [Janthinobacterium lividum]
RVIILPEARTQLRSIFLYIVAEADVDTAERYVESIVDKCDSLGVFPLRGSLRPDLGRGYRSISHRRRCLIVYGVAREDVSIAGVFYGGQDIGAALASD